MSKGSGAPSCLSKMPVGMQLAYFLHVRLLSICHFQDGHQPRKHGKVREFESNHGKVRENAYLPVVRSGQIVGERRGTAFPFRFWRGNAVPLAYTVTATYNTCNRKMCVKCMI